MSPFAPTPSPHSTSADTLLRAALASPFLASGILKLSDWPAAMAEFAGLGIWWPQATVAAVIVTQIVGSLLLLQERSAWIGAGILAGFTAAATIVAHPFWAFDGGDRARQLTTFLEHVALIGGLVAAALLAAARNRAAPTSS